MVSIIVPVFNREKFLPDTIESVLAQTYPDWELILIDDGSTDNSLSILHEMAADDARIRVIERNRSPKGAPTCRNIGLEMASGDYVLFFDSDDFMKPNCLKRRVDFMQENQALEFSVWQVSKKFANGTTEQWSDLNQRDDLLAFLNAKGWQTSSTIFTSGFVKQFTWDEQACSWQDWEFHIRVLLKSSNYLKLSDLDSDILIDRSAGAKITNSNQQPDRILCLLRLFERLKEPLRMEGKAHLHRYLFASYFKFVESAAIRFSREDYLNILSYFSSTGIYKDFKYHKSVRLYLDVLSSLKFTDKHWLQAPVYRIRKIIFPL